MSELHFNSGFYPNHMSGRSRKTYSSIYRDISLELPDQPPILFAAILILCPVCQSALVGTYGTKALKHGRIEMFQCKNPHCGHLNTHQTGKQFSVRHSHRFKQEIMASLGDLYGDLVVEGAKNKTIEIGRAHV